MSTKKIITYKDKFFVINEGVYEPDRYSFFMEDNILVNAGDVVLDLVTGSGFFSVMIAEHASRIIAVDINPKSTQCARLNALLNNVEDKIDLRIGNLYEPVKNEQFDLIIANPPELPTPENKNRKDWVGVSNFAGPDGRALVDPVINGAYAHLKKGGRLQLWHAWYANIPKSIDMLLSLGFSAKITAEKYFSVGLLTFERADYLQKIGHPFIEVNGEFAQYHVVITATKD